MLIDKKYTELKIGDRFKTTSDSDWLVKPDNNLTLIVRQPTGRTKTYTFFEHSIVLVENN